MMLVALALIALIALCCFDQIRLPADGEDTEAAGGR